MNFTHVKDWELLGSFTPYDSSENIHYFYCPATLLQITEEDYGAEWNFKVIAGPEKGRRFLGYTDKDSENTQVWAESLAGRLLPRTFNLKDLEGKKTIIVVEDDSSGIPRAKVFSYATASFYIKMAKDIEIGLEEIEDPEIYYMRRKGKSWRAAI